MSSLPLAERALPIHVTFEHTSACNLRCFMCEHHRPSVSNKNATMPQDLFCKILDEIHDSARVVSLTVTGDPFTDKFLAQRVEAIRKFPDLSLEVVTNAVLLTDDRLRIFAGMENPVYFSISLDSLDPVVYRSIRSQDHLLSVIDNIRRLKTRARRLGIRELHQNISMVMMKRNIREILNYVAMAGELGCDTVGFSHLGVFEESDKRESLFYYPSLTNRLVSQAREKAYALGLVFNAPPPFAVTEEEVKQYSQSTVTICPFLESRIYVGHDGRVEACCHPRRPIMGDLSRQSLREVWNSDLYRNYRDALAQGSPLKPCDSCYILEHYKPFLYECAPFGVLEPPDAIADHSPSLDWQHMGFFDVFKDLNDSEWKKAYLAKLQIELELTEFALEDASHVDPEANSGSAQAFQELVDENRRISQAFQELLDENRRISQAFQELVDENRRISQAFQELLEANNGLASGCAKLSAICQRKIKALNFKGLKNLFFNK
ncbi:MAG: radical SAM protein [Desulfomonile tiedjei]|uniref:Radical SAM protein n=1 Tax=Desulfomonile tiedjei TaxID=2358 RepID=A0A9D6Z2L1_9BACT|nr:radical SAM protein [Desulfomonile tiedjei]